MQKTIRKYYGRGHCLVTFDDMIAQMRQFEIKHGRWPERADFTNNNGFPTPRSLERNGVSSLKALRKHLGIPQDHRTGAIRRKTATAALDREKIYNKLALNRLRKYFPDPMRIHREATVSDDHRNRADFKVYMANGVYMIDLFYAKDEKSWTGCVAHKKGKYEGLIYAMEDNLQEVLFVCMNPAIKKTKNISQKVRVITSAELWRICEKNKVNVIMSNILNNPTEMSDTNTILGASGSVQPDIIDKGIVQGGSGVDTAPEAVEAVEAVVTDSAAEAPAIVEEIAQDESIAPEAPVAQPEAEIAPEADLPLAEVPAETLDEVLATDPSLVL